MIWAAHISSCTREADGRARGALGLYAQPIVNAGKILLRNKSHRLTDEITKTGILVGLGWQHLNLAAHQAGVGIRADGDAIAVLGARAGREGASTAGGTGVSRHTGPDKIKVAIVRRWVAVEIGTTKLIRR